MALWFFDVGALAFVFLGKRIVKNKNKIAFDYASCDLISNALGGMCRFYIGSNAFEFCFLV